MHVLMISWEYPPHIVGGMGQHVIDLVPALVQHSDVRVTLLTPMVQGGEANERTADRVRVVRVPLAQDNYPDHFAFVGAANQALIQAADLLWQETGGFDLIHNHDWLTTDAAVALKRRFNVPMMTTIHATERGRGQGALLSEHAMHINDTEHWLTYEAQRVVVCSEYMRHQVIDYFHLPYDKIAIVPNAVYRATYPFQSEEERQAFRRRFAADHQRLAFFVGRVVHEKGVHVLLDAWARARHHLDARLVIAGVGPYLDACTAQAAALGLNEQVLFPGRISDEERSGLYATADAAIFPSIYEPFGIVALEAMSAACPVLVTRTGGLQDIVRPHETGILVEPNHIDSLVWGILHTLQNPKWARARAQNALHDVEVIYSWHHAASETIRIYRSLLNDWQPEHMDVRLRQPGERVPVERQKQ